MIRINSWIYAAVAIVALGLGVRAEAAPQLQLRVSDGVNPTVLVIDSLNTGIVMHTTAIGNWFVNVTTGIGSPTTGTPLNPLIDLNSINISNTAGGTLTLELTEIGLISSLGTSLYTAAIGGTVSTNAGTELDYAAYTDSTNTAFGTQSLIGSASFTGGAFAYTNTAYGQSGALYSITQVVTLTAAAAGSNTNISFNAELRSVPEPASMMLLGAGLAGLALLRARKA